MSKRSSPSVVSNEGYYRPSSLSDMMGIMETLNYLTLIGSEDQKKGISREEGWVKLHSSLKLISLPTEETPLRVAYMLGHDHAQQLSPAILHPLH